MGSTRNFRKQVGHNPDAAVSAERTLTCGCVSSGPPALSSPDKWFCCGSYRKAKK